MTYEELRKRMPNSRQICEEIYTCLDNGMTEKEAISQTGDKLKVALGYAVKDIINEYQKKDIFKNVKIVVDETPVKK